MTKNERRKGIISGIAHRKKGKNNNTKTTGYGLGGKRNKKINEIVQGR